MSDRCIVAARFTPAGSLGSVRKAVGGFLRYVQHRDLHPQENEAKRQVAGLVKYVAYRDRASARAELFGPDGPVSSADRKAFAAFVTRSLTESRPQLYRNRHGVMVDRRRAVYRLVISPERAAGLDLVSLTQTAVKAWEGEAGAGRLRWIAAIHRNTAHPHVHLVVAGMRQAGDGFVRVDLTKNRLAEVKSAVQSEIERQRGEQHQSLVHSAQKPVGSMQGSPLAMRERRSANRHRPSIHGSHGDRAPLPILRLRAAGLRYRWEAERAAQEEARRRGWERAA